MSPLNSRNIGFHTVVNFASFCDVAPYNFRFHADYGMGGYAGIDGMVDGTSDQFAGDIWGHLMFAEVNLANVRALRDYLNRDRSEVEPPIASVTRITQRHWDEPST